jgi:hypothetical protein
VDHGGWRCEVDAACGTLGVELLEVRHGEAELARPAGCCADAGCSASVVEPVSNSLQPGDWKRSARPSLSRWKATARSMSATYLMAYVSVVAMGTPGATTTAAHGRDDASTSAGRTAAGRR